MDSRNILDLAYTHVTGESEFIDDRLKFPNELVVDFVYSPVARGKIKKIDFKDALQVDGVVGIYTHKDIHHNAWGGVVADQPILAATEVNYIGEPVVVVAAENILSAKKAKKLIKIEIETSETEGESKILDIDTAIKNNYFLGSPQKIETGDVDAVLKTSPHTFKGVFENGGQEHFYFETQSTVAYLKDGDNGGVLELHSSSQHPTEVQHVVAHALGLKQHQVVCIVKRMGGGFGGKEAQASHYAALAALVAYKSGRPARLVLGRDDDMKITGKRHAFKSFYEVGFDEKGKILALKVQMYSNGGAYLDLSGAILQRALFHIDNAYYIPNARIEGKIARTNLPPNTAFRGFGGPQGVAIIENIIEEIAMKLSKNPLDIRKINLYGLDQGKNDVTIYGQTVKNNMLHTLIRDIEESSEYKKRFKEACDFNKAVKDKIKNKQKVDFKLRGISLMPVKFGISFTATFLNQGNALVNVYTDGSIQVSTGATEMGQSVYTKIRGVVSDVFGIDYNLIRVMPTSTEKNPNTSPTAASSGADINCSAAFNAASMIKERLSDFVLMKYAKLSREELQSNAAKNKWTVEFENGEVCCFNNENNNENDSDSKNDIKKIKFTDLVKEAYFARINLGAQAFYKTPEIYFDPLTAKGQPFLYFTQGAAVSEVEIDGYTGNTKILRTDILMDLGKSLNEKIDKGQVAGAYLQGVGWVTTEELRYSDKGALLTHSPTTYKIPNIQDTPRIFNIDLITNDQNTVNIYGSKAVGEPPFLLGISVWTAIKWAINNFNLNANNLNLKIPATAEDILLAL
ncbi:MAG: molybdopterin-dependent oxidoreductase [Oligoflexia bacterium]|nr:molybdopterin-dependent oxidoreductase [Oligoflexia bacterium]